MGQQLVRRPEGSTEVALRCSKQRVAEKDAASHRPSAAQKQQQIAELEEGAEKGASFPVTACGSNMYCTNSGK